MKQKSVSKKAGKLSSDKTIGSAHAAPRLRLVLGVDNVFEILLDDENNPWVRIGANPPQRSTFAEALRRFADLWQYQVDGDFGNDEDYSRFFRLLASKLPQGV